MSAEAPRVRIAAARDRDPTLTEQRIFGPVSDKLWSGWNDATRHLQTLSDAELWHASEWASSLGRSNCGWMTYRLKDDLEQFIAWEQNRREQARIERGPGCSPACFDVDFAGHRADCRKGWT